jgi:hypothetical protein
MPKTAVLSYAFRELSILSRRRPAPVFEHSLPGGLLGGAGPGTGWPWEWARTACNSAAGPGSRGVRTTAWASGGLDVFLTSF